MRACDRLILVVGARPIYRFNGNTSKARSRRRPESLDENRSNATTMRKDGSIGRAPLLWILDRDAARRDVNKAYAPQLEVLREILDWGTHLQARLLKTAPQDPEHAIFAGLFFRRVLEVLDLAEISFRDAHLAGANIAARCMLEAVWSIEYALTDIPYLTRCMLVWSRRRDREWHLRLIPGTAEHTAFRDEVLHIHERIAAGVDPKALTDEVARMDRLLATDPYYAINARFDEIRGQRSNDPNWFAPAVVPAGDRRYPSYRQLARATGHLDEYSGFYAIYSGAVHGSALRDAMTFGPDRIEFEPLRRVDGFQPPFTLTAFLPIRAYRAVLEHFRPDELPAFRETYMTWRERLNNLPRVTITPKHQQL